MIKKKVLIVGASGFLGNYLFKNLKIESSLELIGSYKDNFKNGLIHFDYNSDIDFGKIIEISPDYIIWAAGFKDLKKTELSLSLSLSENYLPIKKLCDKFILKIKPKVIYISTDYVFEGSSGNYSVDDKKNPKSYYGKSKLKAEEHLKKVFTNSHIIRTGGIIAKESNFFNWLIKSLTSEKEIVLYNNFFTPTPIVNIYNAIRDIIGNKLDDKVIHVNGKEKMRRIDIGQLAARAINSRTRIIERPFDEASTKFFKDLSLISSYNSKKNINCSDFIYKLLK